MPMISMKSAFRALMLLTAFVLGGDLAQAGQTASLSELMAGAGPNGNGTLIEGDKVFSLFGSFSSGNGGGATPPLAENIDATTYVNLNGDIGLNFSSAVLNAGPGQSINAGWGYTVTALGGLIVDAELALLSYAAQGGSIIHVTETLSNGITLLANAPAGPTFDHQFFAATQSLVMFNNISVEGNADGSASMGTLSQTFSQIRITPEPSTVASAGLAICAGLASVLRRRFKKT